MSKKLFYILSFIPVLALAQSQDQNYVITTTYKVPTTIVTSPTPEQKTENITYYDGLGRPIQQVAHKQSASGKDIVTPIEYDGFGRQTKEYLPYATTAAASLDYKTTALSDVLSYPDYLNQNPFSDKELENSPLNRVIKQAAPGNAWAKGSGREIKFDYQANTATDAVKLYNITATWDPDKGLYDIPTSLTSTTYDEFQLFKNITKNENWSNGDGNNKTIVEFKDKTGKIILKRTFKNAVNHDTYYVYDQFDNLTFVLPPKADGIITSDVLNDLCYQYKYDKNNRLVEKKLPGKQWEFIVYDKLDRVVASGPTLSPFSNSPLNAVGWIITKYDVFNRPIYTGWEVAVVNSNSRFIKQNNQNILLTSLNETKTTSGTIDNIPAYYSNTVEPTVFKLLTVNYYDDYNFPNSPVFPITIFGEAVYYTNTTKPIGLQTGSWTRVTSTLSSTTFEKNYTLYDSKARPIRNYSSNIFGGYTQTDTQLDFVGKVLSTVTSHRKATSGAILIVTENFTYSEQCLLLTHTHKINNNPTQLLTSNSYDELGKLISKKVGGTDLSSSNNGLQKIDYSYNIRGWLTNINDIDSLSKSGEPTDLFAFKLNYNSVPPINEGGYSVEQYNGNISESYWRSSYDNIIRKYKYFYDDLNRLTYALYARPANPSNPNQSPIINTFNEQITYDKNGNILSLQRNGGIENQTQAPVIDNLAYTYSGNRLNTVEDATADSQGFKDGAHNTTEYGYDLNGNMNRDDNKGIASIKYNHLNLPTEIIFNASQKINYIYNAVGEKIRKTVYNNTTTAVTEYLKGFQYTASVLQFFPTAEGYVKNTLVGGVNTYDYIYNYKDHLGNIRVSYGINPATNLLTIMEDNNYYPFGLKHSTYNLAQRSIEEKITTTGTTAGKEAAIVNPIGTTVGNSGYLYRYNGKEFQDELELNMYAMDMRQYDPAIGRWLAIDPVVHFSYSTYNAFDNNPVVWADPSGADSETDLYGRNKYDRWGNYIPPFERGDTQESHIDKAAIIALKNTAKLYINGVDMSNVSESEKQKIFKTDEIKTIGILLWEFATGTGKEIRKFEVGVHPFANKLIEDRILNEIVNEFNEKAKKDGYDFSNIGNSKEYQIALEFSPNMLPSSWIESVKKHVDSNAVQFFVGGAIAKARIQDNNFIIQITNETSRSSLMLHVGENYDRKDGNKPLSTIKQFVNASYNLNKN